MNDTTRLKLSLGITWKDNIHKRANNHPERLVVAYTSKGWNRCELCGREHRIWITDDAMWKRLPRRLRSARLCTRCYRAEAR